MRGRPGARGGPARRLSAPLAALALLAGCTATPDPAPGPATPPTAPPPLSVLIDKSDRVLEVRRGETVLTRYTGLQFGDAPMGHKRFEGDERTPEGRYVIDYRNPRSSYHLSLHISYPDERDRAYATARGRSPGGQIFIHGQPNGLAPDRRMAGDWTDGCIALSNAQIEALWAAIPNGTPITIQP